MSLQGQNLREVIGGSETMSLKKDPNGALRKWRIKASKNNVCLEYHNQRRDVRAHLR